MKYEAQVTGKDVAIVGGIALAVYFLLPKIVASVVGTATETVGAAVGAALTPAQQAVQKATESWGTITPQEADACILATRNGDWLSAYWHCPSMEYYDAYWKQKNSVNAPMTTIDPRAELG